MVKNVSMSISGGRWIRGAASQHDALPGLGVVHEEDFHGLALLARPGSIPWLSTPRRIAGFRLATSTTVWPEQLFFLVVGHEAGDDGPSLRPKVHRFDIELLGVRMALDLHDPGGAQVHLAAGTGRQSRPGLGTARSAAAVRGLPLLLRSREPAAAAPRSACPPAGQKEAPAFRPSRCLSGRRGPPRQDSADPQRLRDPLRGVRDVRACQDGEVTHEVREVPDEARRGLAGSP